MNPKPQQVIQSIKRLEL